MGLAAVRQRRRYIPRRGLHARRCVLVRPADLRDLCRLGGNRVLGGERGKQSHLRGAQHAASVCNLDQHEIGPRPTRDPATEGGRTMAELIVDFITSLDGYASAEGWPGWWGLQGPEYLAWLGERPERSYTLLMGANTYRQMYGFASQSEASQSVATAADNAMAGLTKLPKVGFSSTL